MPSRLPDPDDRARGVGQDAHRPLAHDIDRAGDHLAAGLLVTELEHPVAARFGIRGVVQRVHGPRVHSGA
jgi:hypothetical protein